MRHVHAFGDDALGDFDAVGLVGRIKSGHVSAAELVEAAVARTEKVNPALNGLAYEAFDRARVRAAAGRVPHGGFFDGVPTYIKDNIDVAGMPTMHGTDAWQPHPAAADGAFARMYLATGLVPIAHANDGGGSIRIPASCNGLVGLKPSRGRLPLDKDIRRMPVRIVYNGVVTRSVRDTAAFYREAELIWHNSKLPAIGDVTGPTRQQLKIAVVTRSIQYDCSPEVRDLTLKTAALLEELGHRVEHVDPPPVPSYFPGDFLLYWAFLATVAVRTGRRVFGPTFDRSRLDNLTLGLDHYARHHLHRLPLATARLAASRRRSARFFRSYDAVLTPTVAHETPPVGYFDPTADYRQIIDRLMAWVAFTPLQNATGDPAISLPLAQTAAGLPLGMMFAAEPGAEARLLGLAYQLEQARPWARIQSCAAH